MAEKNKARPDLYYYENSYHSQGFGDICGIDEAGRGPLAGPVFAAAVILGDEKIEGLDDSKKLSEEKREALFDKITRNASAYAVAFCNEKEIDKINILQASLEAMRRAAGGLSVKPSLALVDGDQNPKLDVKTVCIVGGDAKSASVAAASILAKVSRDRYMTVLDQKYPGYGFAKHKGYPTKEHYKKLDELGVSEIHRKTFLKKYEAARIGRAGENFAARYLEKQGFNILARNWRCPYGEIDVIAENGEFLAFVEVKSRSEIFQALPCEAVDEKKRRKIILAATAYLSERESALQPRFDIMEIIVNPETGKIYKYRYIENSFWDK
ncbi:MAG: ribonuclease HII [Oscillospiraceae bacterium]|jgi:ribonuclease HII|nr:ribonuclease HII [Oscillospiraceae bacterium]